MNHAAQLPGRFQKVPGRGDAGKVPGRFRRFRKVPRNVPGRFRLKFREGAAQVPDRFREGTGRFWKVPGRGGAGTGQVAGTFQKFRAGAVQVRFRQVPGSGQERRRFRKVPGRFRQVSGKAQVASCFVPYKCKFRDS